MGLSEGEVVRILEFIFRDGWTFVGTLLLLSVLASWRPTIVDKSTNIYEGHEHEEN